MHYLSAVIFFFIIWLTQFVSSFERPVNYEQHAQLQQELSAFIEGYVKQQLPTVANFKMHTLYTKPPKKGKIKAFFNYTFLEPTSGITTELDGHAILQKIKDVPQQEWSLDAISISGETLTFSEPIVITPAATSEIDAKSTEKK